MKKMIPLIAALLLNLCNANAQTLELSLTNASPYQCPIWGPGTWLCYDQNNQQCNIANITNALPKSAFYNCGGLCFNYLIPLTTKVTKSTNTWSFGNISIGKRPISSTGSFTPILLNSNTVKFQTTLTTSTQEDYYIILNNSVFDPNYTYRITVIASQVAGPLQITNTIDFDYFANSNSTGASAIFSVGGINCTNAANNNCSTLNTTPINISNLQVNGTGSTGTYCEVTIVKVNPLTMANIGLPITYTFSTPPINYPLLGTINTSIVQHFKITYKQFSCQGSYECKSMYVKIGGISGS